MMGQHKPVAASELAPQVLKALAAMKPGDVSDVIQLEKAYTIVRLNEHAAAGMTRFEDVKAGLQKELHDKKANQLRAELDKKLRRERESRDALARSTAKWQEVRAPVRDKDRNLE